MSDTVDWSNFDATTLNSPENRAMYYYQRFPPGSYRIEFPNISIYRINI